eukprot:2690052-Alexandrium_andersonii.AAC.1
MSASLVGSEMCIRDRSRALILWPRTHSCWLMEMSRCCSFWPWARSSALRASTVEATWTCELLVF